MMQGVRVTGRSVLATAVAVAGVAAAGPAPSASASQAIPAIGLTGAALPVDPATDVAELALPAASSIGDLLIGAYLTIEPWVDYGVELISWALRWLPFGGLLASQLNMFYDLGESVVSAVVFNTGYLLNGTVSFTEALGNIGAATAAAFDTFIDDQIAWLRGLLPPWPPLPSAADAALSGDFAAPAELAELTGLPELPQLPELTELAGLVGDPHEILSGLTG